MTEPTPLGKRWCGSCGDWHVGEIGCGCPTCSGRIRETVGMVCPTCKSNHAQKPVVTEPTATELLDRLDEARAREREWASGVCPDSGKAVHACHRSVCDCFGAEDCALCGGANAGRTFSAIAGGCLMKMRVARAGRRRGSGRRTSSSLTTTAHARPGSSARGDGLTLETLRAITRLMVWNAEADAALDALPPALRARLGRR